MGHLVVTKLLLEFGTMNVMLAKSDVFCKDCYLTYVFIPLSFTNLFKMAI